ncbi:hypothetical protein LX32DRAFT_9246 [Colletotrichum zoysiae]|uniref:Uncharacterized protein n=1 Tax=Colletotrichum zoysiae TaxID=1216348 RepID=A0AAD9HEE7_9PEZI|nr:hypothetical protein LX32DRAFT_9246 [Colletotrichum zoysiae]
MCFLCRCHRLHRRTWRCSGRPVTRVFATPPPSKPLATDQTIMTAAELMRACCTDMPSFGSSQQASTLHSPERLCGDSR